MTLRTARSLIASAFASILFSSPVSAAHECGPLKIFASVDLKMGPDDRAAFVPVTLQGQTKYMLLDTGGTVSEITASTLHHSDWNPTKPRHSGSTTSRETTWIMLPLYRISRSATSRETTRISLWDRTTSLLTTTALRE